MKSKFYCSLLFTVLLAFNGWAKLDDEQIEQLTGMKGSWNESKTVFKVSRPRDDVKVQVEKWAVPPFLGLTTWASFTEDQSGKAVVNGELVLFADEVNSIMTMLLDGGLEITGLKEHFFFVEPRVFFMHIAGESDGAKLATAIGNALTKIKQMRKIHFTIKEMTPGIVPPITNGVNSDVLEKTFGTKSQRSEGMCKFVFGRSTKLPSGMEAGADMGVNSWVGFAGTDMFSAVDGAIAATQAELRGVLRALRDNSIFIVGIESSMGGENPRLYFVHYWGKGKSATLAKGVKAALAALEPGKSK